MLCKVYSITVIKSVQNITNNKIGEQQGRSIDGMGCVDQIFSLRVVVEELLEKA